MRCVLLFLKIFEHSQTSLFQFCRREEMRVDTYKKLRANGKWLFWNLNGWRFVLESRYINQCNLLPKFSYSLQLTEIVRFEIFEWWSPRKQSCNLAYALPYSIFLASLISFLLTTYSSVLPTIIFTSSYHLFTSFPEKYLMKDIVCKEI